MMWQGEVQEGQQAMIIGCKQEKNRYLIGTVCEVVKFVPAGSKWKDIEQYIQPGPYMDNVSTTEDHFVVKHPELNAFLWQPGYGFFDKKFLMPLPPLGDVDIMAQHETPKETSKC